MGWGLVDGWNEEYVMQFIGASGTKPLLAHVLAQGAAMKRPLSERLPTSHAAASCGCGRAAVRLERQQPRQRCRQPSIVVNGHLHSVFWLSREEAKGG